MTAEPELPAVVVTDSPAPVTSFRWSDAPEVSLIVVTYGAGLVVDRCLVALAAAIESDGLDAEVIVVDNLHPERQHSTGDRIALSTSGVRLLQPATNLGFGGGNDAGVEIARGGIIGLINPDLIVEPGQFGDLVGAARRHPDGIVAPALVNTDGTLQEAGMRIIRNGETRPILVQGTYDPDYASAACWFLRRDTYERLDGFDPIYHPAYYEDVDFALRLSQSGGRTIVLDQVRILHEQHSSTTGSALPEVERQRSAFMSRWHDLVASRPVE